VFAHTARVHAFVWRLTSQLESAEMAMLSDAVHDIAAANALLGGSYEHQQHRRHLVTPFLRFARTMDALSQSNTALRSLATVTAVNCAAGLYISSPRFSAT
jgi:hypothetical protein